MWDLRSYKMVFIGIGLLGVLLFSIPSLVMIFPSRVEEHFSQFYLLGSNRLVRDYPFDISSGETYLVYIGLENHMKKTMLYYVYVKFTNQSESLPIAENLTESPSPILYEYGLSLGDSEANETALTFSISDVSVASGTSRIEALTLNGEIQAIGETSAWDTITSAYCYYLLVELWTYNILTQSVNFDGRVVFLKLNVALST
jgi:hypothetical protein